MVRCGWVQKNILLFLEKQMSTDIADKVGKHLLRCNHCSTVANQVEEIREPVKTSLKMEELPPDTLQSGIMARIRSMPAGQDQRADGNVPTIAWIFGGLILLVICALAIGFITGRI